MAKHNDEYIFGLHSVQHVLQQDSSRIIEVWVQDSRRDAKVQVLIEQLQKQDVTLQTVPKKTLDKLAQSEHHQGILLRCQAAPVQTEETLEQLLTTLTSPPFLLVLDEVQDPHNLGACLRTADAAGVHAVIIPKNRSCSITSAVRKVASGAAETMPVIQITNLARTLRWLQEQGVWIIGTVAEADKSLYETELTGAIALVMGAEGTGLRRLTQETCDKLMKIPMLGTVESLNVSVATGICLYEIVRQRALSLKLS